MSLSLDSSNELQQKNNASNGYFLNEETFTQLKKKVKEGNKKEFEAALEVFGLPIDHPFMRDEPELCYRITKLMMREGTEKGRVSKVVLQFVKFSVFQNSKLLQARENLVVKCKDGEVRFNKMVLVLQNDHFNAMLSHNMKESTENVIDLSSQNSKVVIETVKCFFYTGKLNIQNLSSEQLVELHSYMHLIQVESTIIKAIFKEIQKRSKSIASEDQLLNFLNCIKDLAAIDEKEALSLQFEAFCAYLEKVARVFIDDQEKKISLSPSHLPILQKDNAVGALARRFVHGLYLMTQSDLEKALLSMFMSEELRNNMKELVLDSKVSFETFFSCHTAISKIADLFPNIHEIFLFINETNCSAREKPRYDSKAEEAVEVWNLENMLGICPLFKKLKKIGIYDEKVKVHLDCSHKALDSLGTVDLFIRADHLGVFSGGRSDELGCPVARLEKVNSFKNRYQSSDQAAGFYCRYYLEKS